MKLGLQLGYWQAQPPTNHVALAQEAERLGYDSVWTAEAWGSDAFTPLAWIGAQTTKIKLATGIVQISARTPASRTVSAAGRPPAWTTCPRPPWRSTRRGASRR